MSISPVDNNLAALGGLSPAGDAGIAGLEPREVDRALRPDGAAAPLNSETDAQSLLAQDVWSAGAGLSNTRLFDPAIQNAVVSTAATPDDLDNIATDVLSFIT